MQPVYYNVKEYGAIGNGKVKDTQAIQAAIDAADQQGGGTIYFPAGKYLSGTISLKSHICLVFAPGACIFASVHREDYPKTLGSANSSYRDDRGQLLGDFSGLIYGYDVEDVTIIGGMLTTDDKAFWISKGTEDTFERAASAMPWHYYDKCSWRIMMLMFEDCRDITVSSLRIEQYPVYAGWLLGCQNVFFQNLFVKANVSGPNTDGLHFSSCRNVRIVDSRFVCGDDCIAIDGNHRGAGEQITISGCSFHTTVHAIRIYTGLDPAYMIKETSIRRRVKNVSISACTVENACGILSINADCGEIENVTVSNFSAELDWEGTPFVLSARHGSVRRVVLNGMTVKANGFGMICAAESGDISDVDISHVLMDITPKTKIYRGTENFFDHCHFRPSNLVIKHARRVKLSAVRVVWHSPEYSHEWASERRKRLVDEIGEEILQLGEPGSFPVCDMVDCKEVCFADVDMPDFDQLLCNGPAN